MIFTMKVAHSALRISLALRAGVRETGMAAPTYILRDGADAVTVSGGGAPTGSDRAVPGPGAAAAGESLGERAVLVPPRP
jgi:hypothetical protein